MKINNKIVIPISIIVTLPFLIALFSKKSYTIEREVVIFKKKEIVFDYLKMLNNHEQYDNIFLLDQKMTKKYTGTDGKEGCILFWISDESKIGKGELEIKKITTNDSIIVEKRYLRPHKYKETNIIVAETESSGITKVRWVINGEAGFPLNLNMMFVNFEDDLGKNLDLSLENLKNNFEKQK